jgi:hypothetical protein
VGIEVDEADLLLLVLTKGLHDGIGYGVVAAFAVTGTMPAEAIFA